MSAHKNCQCSFYFLRELTGNPSVQEWGHQITCLYSEHPFLFCKRIINDLKCLSGGWGIALLKAGRIKKAKRS